MSVYTRLTKEELEQLLYQYDIGEFISVEGINEGITNSNSLKALLYSLASYFFTANLYLSNTVPFPATRWYSPQEFNSRDREKISVKILIFCIWQK